MAHLLEMERVKEAQNSVVEAAVPAEEEALEALTEETTVEDDAVASAAHDDEDDDPVTIAPRRMQFQFEGDTA